jgi:hypothetical protein
MNIFKRIAIVAAYAAPYEPPGLRGEGEYVNARSFAEEDQIVLQGAR